MKHFYRHILIITAIFAGFLCFSCTDFFTTSLFPWASRNPNDIIPKVTKDNVDDLIELFENDPDGSLALLKKIKDAAGEASGDEKNQLLGAALEAAVNASGLGQAIISAAGNINNLKDEEDVRGMLLETMDKLTNLEETSAILSGMLPKPGDYPDHPNPEFLEFCDKAKTEDLAMAAVVLLLGVASKSCDGDFNALLDDPLKFLDNKNLDFKDSVELAQAMALVAAIKGKDEILEKDSPLRNILEHLNLISVLP